MKNQNNLASLQRTSDRIASSVTQKITSEIKVMIISCNFKKYIFSPQLYNI